VREDARKITDPKTLRVLAHPVRFALLNHLMTYRERTASQCAAAVDASPSACSYHLRELAKVGIVEPVPAEDGRERPWRATGRGFSFRAEPGDAAGLALQNNVAAVMLDRGTEAARDFLLRIEHLDEEWRNAASLGGYALVMTATELAELIGRLDELIAPYRTLVRDDPPAGAARVHMDLHAFPLPEAD
jgi:DNA-binding transcriptional ArsR family regulator